MSHCYNYFTAPPLPAPTSHFLSLKIVVVVVFVAQATFHLAARRRRCAGRIDTHRAPLRDGVVLVPAKARLAAAPVRDSVL